MQTATATAPAIENEAFPASDTPDDTADDTAALGPLLPSPIESASSSQWTNFVRRMITQKLSAVSESNALGLFEILPRRLHDLGLLSRIQRRQSTRSNRQIWTGKFVPPLTSTRFLKSALAQYTVFCNSMKDYASKIESGEIEMQAGMSLSGALALLHRAGPHGLKTRERFPVTQALFERCNGVF